ncbi:hypothetical protein NEOLEDRAFT_1244042 [Neolentinus lepideus HHB14362 ss-1]|uniref:Uncharacterized protein n=1 Tax=Neolentinus lepideus HHB14362 ss-1 TaxID=1314782 RepID=A0A165QB35_9AGAM|nr:hypothetical protein NEOLEDRAFT_1244042 [Neolentinus lepideus HHB14362 ss-1]
MSFESHSHLLPALTMGEPSVWADPSPPMSQSVPSLDVHLASETLHAQDCETWGSFKLLHAVRPCLHALAPAPSSQDDCPPYAQGFKLAYLTSTLYTHTNSRQTSDVRCTSSGTGMRQEILKAPIPIYPYRPHFFLRRGVFRPANNGRQGHSESVSVSSPVLASGSMRTLSHLRENVEIAYHPPQGLRRSQVNREARHAHTKKSLHSYINPPPGPCIRISAADGRE